MAPKKKTAKKVLGKKELKKTKGGIIAVRMTNTAGITDGTSNTLLLPAVQKVAGDGSV